MTAPDRTLVLCCTTAILISLVGIATASRAHHRTTARMLARQEATVAKLVHISTTLDSIYTKQLQLEREVIGIADHARGKYR